MKKVLLIMSLFACEKTPLAPNEVRHGEYIVEKLFTHDGCTVYRFHDYHPVYFTNCDSTAWQENCGKGCVREQQVETKVKP